MNNRPILLLIMAWFGLFSACSKKSRTSVAQYLKSTTAIKQEVSSEEIIDSLATQYLKTDYKVQYNTSQTVALIFRTLISRPQSIHGTVSFLLYHLPSNKILLRETVPQASVEWVDDTHIQVSTIPGIIPGDKVPRGGYLYDTQTQKKKNLKK